MVNPTSIILDVDTGIDDALAIGMAVARADIDLIAVTTLAGNIDVENATENSRRVLGFLGANSIPVHRGASRPLVRAHQDASDYHGANGLGDSYLP
jgi:inosine-uridine nucleoside N-ribohydrolase